MLPFEKLDYCEPCDRRKWKRHLRKLHATHPCYLAYCEGQMLARYPEWVPPRLRTNPYPPGRRHAEWQRGYDECYATERSA